MAFPAAEYGHSLDANMNAEPQQVSGSLHATHEEPAAQALTAQHHTPLLPSQSSHHTETVALQLPAAAEVLQSPAVQSQTITEHPVAGSFDLNAEPPGAMATYASVEPPTACLNGFQCGSWDQPHSSELDGLGALAQPHHQEPEGPELEAAGTQPAETGSYGWYAGDGGSDRQPQDDLCYTELVIAHGSREQEIPQTYAAKDAGQEPASDSQRQDALVCGYIAANIPLPSQTALPLVEPVLLGQKRQLSDNGNNGTQDSIVNKKQCLALSGPVY